MKLYLAETIKRLRLAQNLTQEQLAERLGVSYQSVSRWEGGSSYPDIELIPEIAAFFRVSTDVIMGVEKATMEYNLEKEKKRLRTGEFASAEEELAYTEELHRKYPHDRDILIHLIYLVSSAAGREEELKRLIGDYFAHPEAEKVYIDQCIGLLAAAEQEENLPALLKKYAAEEDLRRESLLLYRAKRRNEPEKAVLYRQYTLLSDLYRLFHSLLPGSVTPAWFNWAQGSEQAVRTKLAIIAQLTDSTSAHPVVGDGQPDLWYSERMAYGYQLAGNLALAGRTGEALALLEELVGLAERFYSLPEGSVLTFRCPGLNRLRATLRYGVRNPDDVFDFSENLHRCMRSEETFFGVDLHHQREDEFDHNVWCPAWDIVPLTDTGEWSCFDAIRSDSRFSALVKRMERLILPIQPA